MTASNSLARPDAVSAAIFNGSAAVHQATSAAWFWSDHAWVRQHTPSTGRVYFAHRPEQPRYLDVRRAARGHPTVTVNGQAPDGCGWLTVDCLKDDGRASTFHRIATFHPAPVINVTRVGIVSPLFGKQYFAFPVHPVLLVPGRKINALV